MVKRLVILSLEFGAGLAGNLVAGWIQGTLWSNAFTVNRLTGTAAGAVIMLCVLAWTESERALHWTWRWHRYWYLLETLENSTLQRWEGAFAHLEMAERSRELFRTEVLINGERIDLIALLQDSVTGDVNKARRLLLLGEPGSGKTTAMEHLTLILTREGVRRLGVNTLIPILVRLGDFQEGVLFEQLKQTIRHGTRGRSGKVIATGLETLLEKGRLVLLFDALDEALGDKREEVLAQIGSFVKSQSYYNVPVIITCRTREDPGGRLDDLEVFEIQNLNDASVREMIQQSIRERIPYSFRDMVKHYGRKDMMQYYAEYYGSTDTIPTYENWGLDANDIERKLKDHGLLGPQEIGRNPFWLSLILQSGIFARNKGEILNNAIKSLLVREWDKPKSKRSWEKNLPKEEQLSETMRGLAWLAYQMSTRSQVFLDIDDALDELRQWSGARVGAHQLRAQDILALGRDALLLNYETGFSSSRIQPVRFRHRLLQEFLTAWALQSQKELLTQELIEQFIADIGWKETFLMLGGIEPDHKSLVMYILGSHPNVHRIIVAVGLLQSINKLDNEMAQELTLGLAECLRRDFTDENKKAVADMTRATPLVFTRVLTVLLQQFDQEIKMKAIEILKIIRNQESAEVLVTSLADPSVADSVLDALVCIDEPAVVPLIDALLYGKRFSYFKGSTIYDWDGLIKIKAARALEQMRQSAVVPLLKYFEKSSACEIAKVLGNIKDERAVNLLIKVLLDNKVTPEKKVCAAKALGDLADHRAVDALIDALAHEDWEVRRSAVDALAKIKDTRAVTPILELLCDNNSGVRISAAQAIGKLGDKTVIGTLITALRDPLNDASIRQSIIGALCNIGHHAVEPLASLIHDNNSFLQVYAIEALGKIADSKSTNTLLALLHTDNRSVLLCVVKALERISDSNALPHLKLCLEKALQNTCDDTELINVVTRAIEKLNK
jgi:HEAT repeat protein/energy-coupling factor transporter ATP-binding protein EcfA2